MEGSSRRPPLPTPGEKMDGVWWKAPPPYVCPGPEYRFPGSTAAAPGLFPLWPEVVCLELGVELALEGADVDDIGNVVEAREAYAD